MLCYIISYSIILYYIILYYRPAGPCSSCSPSAAAPSATMGYYKFRCCQAFLSRFFYVSGLQVFVLSVQPNKSHQTKHSNTNNNHATTNLVAPTNNHGSTTSKQHKHT